MIIRVRGYNSGFAEYLRTGKKEGSSLHRDELDKRIILHGDLDVTDNIVNAMPDKGDDRYLHITLSFKEDYISKEQLKTVLDEFRTQLFNAYDEEEYAFYAEAHLPKIKSVLNESTGEMEERKPHIHIIIPKVNMCDGSYLSPVGYYPHNERYIEAIQESINTKYGLESPRDNRRLNITEISDFISRYKGDVFKSDAKGVKQELLSTILSTENITYDTFIHELKKNGVVKLRKGISGDYLNLKKIGSPKGVNLKEFVFSREFINLSKSEKLNYLSSQVATRTDDKKKQDEVNDTVSLEHWLKLRSYEIKYLHPNSKEFKSYKQMDDQSKLRFIDRFIQSDKNKTHNASYKTEQLSLSEMVAQELKEKYRVRRNQTYQEPSVSQDDGRGTFRIYNQRGQIISGYTMRELHSSSMDVAIYKETSLFLQSVTQENMDVSGERVSPALRYPIDRVDDRDGGGESTINLWKQRREYSFAELSVKNTSKKADNVVESLRVNIIDSAMTIEEMDKEKWKLIHRHINVLSFLKALEHTHGLSSEKYSVSKAKDGSDRIRCSNRNYSVNDFLTKELNFNWSEASEYILSEFSRQESKGDLHLQVTPSIDYWAEFRSWKQKTENSYQHLWAQFRSEQKAIRAHFHKGYRERARQIRRDNPELRARNFELARLKLEKMAALEALERELNIERQTFRNSMVTRNRYIEFLQKRSEDGDSAALHELRRYTKTSQSAVPDYGFIQQNQQTASILYSDITFRVRNNGNVSYFFGKRLVVEDSREWVSVIEKDDEKAIIFALRLALEKNGNSPLTLTGDHDFRTSVAALAAQQNIRVNFNDKEIQNEYERIFKEEKKEQHPEKTQNRPKG
ncbi:LPD7 domain-containing protein [Escherichia coli]|nr:LPD7 domain-containing protein [Escherichia coli]MDY8698507.1 LPD7 domain-containing protein [Escherichia coli]MDY8725016.1 LPD7 domain-containing protein [Escherichia coli]MDY8846042.1 LPD7 domain-containing protein [Escherichia coli]